MALLTGLGLDPARLIVDNRALNTFENAGFAKPLANPQPGQTWLLITSAAHMPRAVGVFRQAGWPVLPYPVSYKADSGPPFSLAEHLGRLDWATHEWTGLVVYRLLGRTDAVFPGP